MRSAVVQASSRAHKALTLRAANACRFHGIESSLLEVVASPETYLYLPNTRNASHILTGDKEVLASDPKYNVTGHFTQSFVADVP